MLYLTLFGHVTLTRRDGAYTSRPVGVEGRPGNLLAFLALAKGRFFSRAELLATLWTEDVRTGTFNTVLWRLRRLLSGPPLQQPAIIVSDRRGAVGLEADADIELDVHEFARLARPVLEKPMESLDENDIREMLRAIAIYRDDILTGFTDDWALRERELHRRMHLNVLARLMQVAVLGFDHASAIRYGQAILDRDPLREDIHRELMRLFLVSGQRAAALRQFEICRAALRKELAIQPMRETLAVYQQIAESAVGRAPGAANGPASTTVTVAPDVNPESNLRGPVVRRAAHDLVVNARRHLAQADAELRESLPYFTGDTGSRPPL